MVAQLLHVSNLRKIIIGVIDFRLSFVLTELSWCPACCVFFFLLVVVFVCVCGLFVLLNCFWTNYFHSNNLQVIQRHLTCKKRLRFTWFEVPWRQQEILKFRQGCRRTLQQNPDKGWYISRLWTSHVITKHWGQFHPIIISCWVWSQRILKKMLFYLFYLNLLPSL